MAYFDRVQPRPVEYLVAVHVNDFFDGSSVNTSEAAHSLDKLTLGFVGVCPPTCASTSPATPAVLAITKAGKRIFCFLVSVRRIYRWILHFVLVSTVSLISEERPQKEDESESDGGENSHSRPWATRYHVPEGANVK